LTPVTPEIGLAFDAATASPPNSSFGETAVRAGNRTA
jgi:hypothetical protein